MANRVLIGPLSGDQVVRVSRPGFDVTDDTLEPNMLAFDSRWLETGRFLYTGSAVTNHDTGSGAYFQFDYPVAFAAGDIPVVIIVYPCGTLSGQQWQTLAGSLYYNTRGGFFVNSSIIINNTYFRFFVPVNGARTPFNYYVLSNIF